MDDPTQNPTVPQNQATPSNELPNLGPQANTGIASSSRVLPVSDANLKPLEVNLPTSVPAPVQPVNTTPIQPIAANPTQPVQPPQTVVQTPLTQPLPPLATTIEQPQVFVNPNPPPVPQASGIPTPGNPFANQTSDQPPTPNQVNNNLHKSHFNKLILVIIILFILFVGGGAFVLNEFVLNKITNLNLISENSQFYLSLAVKKNPQAEQAKITIKKFPGGDRILKEFDKYYTEFTGTDPKNVLNDLTQYANTELLFARQSRAKDNEDNSDRLINIVDLNSAKEASDGVANFSDDTATYKVTENEYKGVKYSSIKLLSEQKLYESRLNTKDSYYDSFSTPKPQARLTAAIDKFIFSSGKEDDVKTAIDISQKSNILGMSGDSSPKSILEATDHKKISALFPKETFIKFFVRDPITPFSSSNPLFNTSVTTSANAAETEAETFQKVTRGLDAVITDDGVKLGSYSLDQNNSQNTFKINQSLAANLPQKFAGVAPTFYMETQNIQAQWKQELKIAEQLKDSKSRTQREQFTNFLDSQDKMKKSYQDTYGIDYESDVLSWLDGQIGIVFNAGKTKKGPEILLIAQTKNSSKAEGMINKLKIPDYSTPSYSYDSEGNIQYDTQKPPPLKFIKSAYKDASIYTLTIPGTDSYGVKYSYYVAISKTKVIMAVSDTDQSLKETIDSESKPAEILTKNSAWQKQFGKVNDAVGDIAFAEPANLMGLIDYLKSVYPQYKEAGSSYSGVSSTYLDDIEKAVRGYLKTIPSIGAYSGQDKDVSYSKVFINIVELPKAEKKEAEDALGRLLKADSSNSYKSVLGINSETTFGKAQKDWNKFFEKTLRPILDPQNVLN